MTSPFVILTGHSPRTVWSSSEKEPPWFKVVPGDPALVYLLAGSQVFAVSADIALALARGDGEALNLIRRLADTAANQASSAVALPAWNALSLNVAQACNLTCDYCYADEGRFGGHARVMKAEVAVAAVSRFLNSASRGKATIGFIGGEPFLNRDAIHASVDYAANVAAARGIDVRFSITTNGSLLTNSDVDFLRRHRFTVSISIDGSEATNDSHRHGRYHDGSFERVRKAIRPLLSDPQGCRVAARATITRDDLDVLDRLDTFEAMGFTESGVSPLRTSPNGNLALGEADWPILLSEMCRAGERERVRVRAGLPFRFSNLHTAIQQIHKGHSLPLPCGAGGNYLSANAEGDFFTCHRTIDDRRFQLGGLSAGPSDALRASFLEARHVDRQEPCRTCWARYLCGGGCHAEVISTGRQGCDFIRGWLEYCLRFHHWVLNHAPHLLREPTK